MKMKQISDSTIKITIQLEDLEERGMEIADFLVPQEKTEEFFYAILDELCLLYTSISHVLNTSSVLVRELALS